MTLARRIIVGAILFALALGLPARAAQNSVVMPAAGPMSMATFVSTYLNPGLQSLFLCSSGAVAPTNGIGASSQQFQCWWDTSASPYQLRYYDGTAWPSALSLDATAHSISLSTSEPVTPHVGTSYPLVDADKQHLHTFSNASPVAVSIAQAGAGSNFLAGWFTDLQNLGTGTVTITPATSTIDGGSSFQLKTGQGIKLVSDGTNYQVWRGFAPVAFTAPTHQFLTSISAVGQPASAQPGCGDLSDSQPSCSTDATNASNISSGTLPAARLPLPTVSTLGGIEAILAVSHQWVDAISTSGVPHLSQPSFADFLSSLACSQTPALTGDVTTSAGSCATALGNIPSATPLAGSLLATNIAAPSSPAAGKVSVFTDSTDLRLHDKNASGVIGTTVVADTGAANNYISAISAAGVITKSRPACSTLSDSTYCNVTLTNGITRGNLAQGSGLSVIGVAGSTTGNDADIAGTASQFFGVNAAGTSLGFQTMTGDVTLSGPAATIAANAVTNAKAAQMAAFTFKGNATGSTANASDFTVASLTNKPSPVGADEVMIADSAASGATKYSTLTQLLSAVVAGVSSFDNKTGAVVFNIPPQGRLTLNTGTPVMLTSFSNKGTLFYDCLNGSNQVPYYDGTVDNYETISGCEVSDAMAASGTGVLNTANVFDVWWVHTGANRICVATNGSGGGWASDTGGSNTARGTGYSQLDTTTRPYITNKNLITHCYNAATDYGTVSANRATYLGTIYTSAAGKVSWTYGVSGTTPTPGMFGLFNAYNQVLVATSFADTTATYTYASSTIREQNGSTNNQVSFVIGNVADIVSCGFNLNISSSGSTPGVGCGLNTTTAFSGPVGGGPGSSGASFNALGTYDGLPGLGLNVFSANEANSPTGTLTVFSGGANYTGGLTTKMKM